jgi:hypothetical protein
MTSVGLSVIVRAVFSTTRDKPIGHGAWQIGARRRRPSNGEERGTGMGR